MAEYKWTKGAFVAAKAQIIGSHLESLRQKHNGILTPEILVQDAARSRSPLHRLFTWDDEEAAQQWRLTQARYIIRHVAVVVENGGHKELRAFVNVAVEDESVFTSLAVAMSSADLRAQVLQRAMRELQGWRDRYREYEELAAVFEAADKMIKTQKQQAA